MNKIKKALAFILVAVCFIGVGVSCKRPSLDPDELDYGNYERASADKDSWLQIDPDDEDVSITWWVDSTSWDFYQISSLVYKRTGVKINFQKALRSDGTELSTMISGNNMYDVITITSYDTRSQLAEQKYVYAIDKLAELYAPTLLDRIGKEFFNYFSASDGHIYGLMNNYFSDEDIKEYDEQGGNIKPLYGIVVRKDMLNAYLDYKKKENPSYDVNSAMDADQFVEMCVWGKKTYKLDDGNPTVCLSDFPQVAEKENVCSSLSALMEYFCVPREDSNGNLLYQYEQPEFLECLNLLNKLFRERLVISNNFGYTSSNIITHIKNGLPFAVIGRPEAYATGFSAYSSNGIDKQTKESDPSHEYVSIVVTNKKGDAPVIVDKSGRGLRFSMITNKCKRVDRVIKVFDYLLSEQGQRECYYGEKEGDYYTFKVRPGETDPATGRTSKYGIIEWTDKAKSLLGAQSGSGWYNAGIKQISLLANPLYADMTSPYGVSMDTYQWYKSYDMLCGLIPYTYSKTVWDFDIDAQDKDYNELADIRAEIEYVWISYLPTIIMADGEASVKNLYDSAMKKVMQKGLERLMASKNAYYQKYKDKMGIKYGWPKADPNYVSPDVSLLGGYEQYKKDMPDYYVFN